MQVPFRLNPPGPCGLSRLSTLPSLSLFGTEINLSKYLGRRSRTNICFPLPHPPLSADHIKRQARASKTPKTQSGHIIDILVSQTGHIVDILFSFGLSYTHPAESLGSPFKYLEKPLFRSQDDPKHNQATLLILRQRTNSEQTNERKNERKTRK